MNGLVLASATGLTAVFLFPQIARVSRRGDVSGLSPTWASFGLITNLAWIFYLGNRGLWTAAIAPALAVATYGAMVVVLFPRAVGREWRSATAAYVLTLLAAAVVGGPEALGLFLVMSPVIQMTPAILAAYRDRCPTGISAPTWGLSAIEAGLWGWYGWLVGDLALLGYGVVTGVGSLVVLRRWMAARPRLRPALTGRVRHPVFRVT